MTSVIVQPAVATPVTVVQGDGLPVVVVDTPEPAPVVVVQPPAAQPTTVVQTIARPIVIVNPVINGGGGGGGGGYIPPTTYHVTAISSFSRAHEYPYEPEVRVITAGNVGAITAVEYPDSSHVYLEFPTPFTGTIILS
jgi:hypothetical protein